MNCVTAVVAAFLVVAAPLSAQASATPDRWLGQAGGSSNAAENAGEHTLTNRTAARARITWRARQSLLPAGAPVVLGGVAFVTTPHDSATASELLAVNTKTAATVWKLQLPDDISPDGGITVTGHLLLLAYSGAGANPVPGGILAIDHRNRSILWRSALPEKAPSAVNNRSAIGPYTDGQQVYVTGAGYAAIAYRISDGSLLWHVDAPPNPRITPPAIDGMAAASGRVYVIDGSGLVAYDGTTGQQLWQAPTPAYGSPIIAGSHVLTLSRSGVAAYSATGCGTRTCAPQWSTAMRDQRDGSRLTLGTADANDTFVTYSTGASANGCTGNQHGHLARLATATGKLRWETTIGLSASAAIRGGNTIWLLAQYPNTTCNPDDYPTRIIAYPATAKTAPKPLVALRLTSSEPSNQNLAVANGTLLYRAGQHLLAATTKPSTS